MSDTPLFLKWLRPRGVPDSAAINGSTFVWPLPRRGQPGEWTPVLDDIAPCYRGYHAATVASAAAYIPPESARPALYLLVGNLALPYQVQVFLNNPDEKIVFSQARLIRRLGPVSFRAAWQLSRHIYSYTFGGEPLPPCLDDLRRDLAAIGLTPDELARLVITTSYSPDGDTNFITGQEFFA